jgi:DNA primase
MSKKYLCPKHEEKTPSANAYADGYHCFGCGARGPLSELGLPAGERIEITYVEDIASSIARIKNLPKQEIRGFQLHADSTGYYLLWPNDTYYKRRIYGAESGNKYRGPSGHSKPWFEINRPHPYRLAIVEGEFNSLSLATLELPLAICSPGGAGDFYSKGAQKNMERASRFEEIHIIVDADAAGAQAAIETKAKLITLGCSEVKIHLVEKDFNDILVQDGKEALRAKCKEMGLL